MSIPVLIVLNVVIALAAVLHWLGPLGFRRGVFFGVTVDPEFLHTDAARIILSRYRRPVIVTAVLCAASLWFAAPRLSGVAVPIATTSILFIQISVAAISMLVAGRHVRPFAKQPAAARTVSLLPRKRTLPGGRLLFAGPMLIVIAARLLLFLRRESLAPEIYLAASKLLIVPFFTNALFLWVASQAIFNTRQINHSGPAAAEEDGDRRLAYWLKLVGAYYVTVVGTHWSLIVARVAAPRSPLAWIYVGLWFVLSMTIAVQMIRRGMRPSEASVVADTVPATCWKLGFIYYNPDDSALFVPTRLGRFCSDLNFGNKQAWVASAVILATPLIIRFLWF